jgi:hypothetical protein
MQRYLFLKHFSAAQQNIFYKKKYTHHKTCQANKNKYCIYMPAVAQVAMPRWVATGIYM